MDKKNSHPSHSLSPTKQAIQIKHYANRPSLLNNIPVSPSINGHLCHQQVVSPKLLDGPRSHLLSPTVGQAYLQKLKEADSKFAREKERLSIPLAELEFVALQNDIQKLSTDIIRKRSNHAIQDSFGTLSQKVSVIQDKCKSLQADFMRHHEEQNNLLHDAFSLTKTVQANQLLEQKKIMTELRLQHKSNKDLYRQKKHEMNEMLKEVSEFKSKYLEMGRQFKGMCCGLIAWGLQSQTRMSKKRLQQFERLEKTVVDLIDHDDGSYLNQGNIDKISKIATKFFELKSPTPAEKALSKAQPFSPELASPIALDQSNQEVLIKRIRYYETGLRLYHTKLLIFLGALYNILQELKLEQNTVPSRLQKILMEAEIKTTDTLQTMTQFQTNHQVKINAEGAYGSFYNKKFWAD